MTLSHPAATRDAIGDAVLALIDAGSAGKVVFQNATKTATYATVPLATPTSGTVATATGIITFTMPQSETSCSSGTTTKAEVQDASSAAVLLGDVGTATPNEFVLSNNVLGSGDTLQLTAMTYTPPT